MEREKFDTLRLRFPDARIEYAKTRNEELPDGSGYESPPPPGVGWIAIDGDSAHTKWARIWVPLID